MSTTIRFTALMCLLVSCSDSDGSEPEGLGDTEPDTLSIDIFTYATMSGTATGRSCFLANDNNSGSFVQSQSDRGVEFPVTIAVADMNNDGQLEAVLGWNRRQIAIGKVPDNYTVINIGGQSLPDEFIDHTVVGDMDSDGDLDIVVDTDVILTSVVLIPNEGVPEGQEVPTFGDPVSFGSGDAGLLAVADLDGSGELDVIKFDRPVQVWLDPGVSEDPVNFVIDGSGGSVDADIGDVDGDGDLDLALAIAPSPRLALNLGDTDGNGQPNFNLVTLPTSSTFPTSISLADLTGDGMLDIYLSYGSTPPDRVLIFDGVSNEEPTYRVQTLPQTEMPGNASSAIGDLDGDGDLDVVVITTTDATKSFVLYNEGVADELISFELSTLVVGACGEPLAPATLVLGDMNGDGSGPFVTDSGMPYVGPGMPYPLDTSF